MRFAVVVALAALSLHAEVRLPKYTRKQLSNGAVVIVIPRPGIPLVQFRIAVKGGAEADPVGMAGLADITAQLLRKGAGAKSAEQFSTELDSLGGTFVSGSSETGSIAAAEFLRKDFSAGLGLVADAVLHPTFPEAEVKKLVGQSVERVKAVKDSPPAAINVYARRFFYGPGHPYGRVTDEASLAGITRQSIVDFHRRQYVGRNMIIVAAGDLDADTALPALEKVFGAVPAGTAYQFQAAKKPLPGGRLLLIDKPDATQTYFEIMQPGIRRADPERTSVMLLNTLFGGRFTSLLNDALRVNSGLTYGASSRLVQSVESGTISISTYTRTDTTEKAMDLALQVLKKFHDQGINAEQLASVKAYMKGTFPTQNLETTDQVASVVTDIEIYGLNKGEVDDLFSRIDALTLERANALIQKRYATEGLTFVVLGNAEKIRAVVKKYAPEVVEVSVKDGGFGK